MGVQLTTNVPPYFQVQRLTLPPSFFKKGVIYLQLLCSNLPKFHHFHSSTLKITRVSRMIMNFRSILPELRRFLRCVIEIELGYVKGSFFCNNITNSKWVFYLGRKILTKQPIVGEIIKKISVFQKQHSKMSPKIPRKYFTHLDSINALIREIL